jgi:hypothetical protein
MKQDYIILFTSFGLGDGPAELQKNLVVKYLGLTLESEQLPAKILFYTDGVRLACEGSPVLDLLEKYAAQGVELVLCKTCLDYFHLNEQVKVGIVGGMPDILEVLQAAPKVLSL